MKKMAWETDEDMQEPTGLYEVEYYDFGEQCIYETRILAESLADARNQARTQARLKNRKIENIRYIGEII
jgi:hypothetical protein